MDVQQVIKGQVTGNPAVLYMKGTPQFPQCGFSQTAIQILGACGVKSLFTVNVLEEPSGELQKLLEPLVAKQPA